MLSRKPCYGESRLGIKKKGGGLICGKSAARADYCVSKINGGGSQWIDVVAQIRRLYSLRMSSRGILIYIELAFLCYRKSHEESSLGAMSCYS